MSQGLFGSHEQVRRAAWMLLAVLGVLLFVGGPHADSARSFKQGWQFGHVLLFWLLGRMLLPEIERRWRLPWGLLLLGFLAATFLVGALIEWLQSFVGRESSWDDVRLDLTGAAIAVGAMGAGRWGRLAGVGLVVLALGSLAWLNARPFLIAVVDEYRARQEFPVLAPCRSGFELGRWAATGAMRLVDAPDRPGGKALQFDLLPSQYSGFQLQYFPSDWRGFDRLVLDIRVPEGAPGTLTCRIHDEAHNADNRFEDRYNGRFDVRPGWNRLDIPLETVRAAPAGRQMDMGAIAGFGCFFVDLDRPRGLQLGAVALK